LIDEKQEVLGKLFDGKEKDKIFNQNNIMQNVLKNFV